MYRLMIQDVLDLDPLDRPYGLKPRVYTELVEKSDVQSESVILVCDIGLPCLQYDYLFLRNVGGGILCSQKFIDTLILNQVPCTFYPVLLRERVSQQPLDKKYFFLIPKIISHDEAIDWERSEEMIDEETGVRWLTKLVLKDEHKLPLLFVTNGRYLIHETLQARLIQLGLSGMLFAPLDAFKSPYAGVRRLEIETCLREHPENWLLWYELSSVCRTEDVISTLQQCIALNPNSEKAWYKLGLAQSNNKDLQNALVSLEKAIEINPESHAWDLYSRILSEVGQTNKALDAALQWVSIKGSVSPFPWYTLAKIYAGMNRYDKAIDALDQGSTIRKAVGSHMEEIFLLRGNILYRLGRYQEALEAYDQGISTNPKYRELYKCKLEVLRYLKYSSEVIAVEKKLNELEEQRKKNLKQKPR